MKINSILIILCIISLLLSSCGKQERAEPNMHSQPQPADTEINSLADENNTIVDESGDVVESSIDVEQSNKDPIETETKYVLDMDIQHHEAIQAYEDFLNGITKARLKGGSTIHIGDWDIWPGGQERRSHETYALFDMNGDGIPELHIRSSFYYIFTYSGQEVIEWYLGALYDYPTNDGALLYTRHGGAPPHISYQYKTLDFDGNILSNIVFEKADIDYNDIYDDKDDYFFEEDKVPKSDWDALTETYLASASDSIIWYQA